MQIYNDGHEIYKNVGVMHAVVFADGAREAKIAQVVGENQNFEGSTSAIKFLIFACKYMFSILFAAILQKCASGSHRKHNFANCIFDANSHQLLVTHSFLSARSAIANVF